MALLSAVPIVFLVHIAGAGSYRTEGQRKGGAWWPVAYVQWHDIYGLKILSRKKLDLWLCWRVVYQNVGKSLQYLFIVSSFGEKIQCICFGWWLLTRCSGTVCNWRLIASVMSAFEFWPKHWLGLRISISFSSLLPLLLLRRRKKMKIRSTTTLIVKDELPKVFFKWGGGGEGKSGIVDKNFCLGYKGWVIFLRWSRNRWCSVRP